MDRDQKIVIRALIALQEEIDTGMVDTAYINDFFLRIPPSLLNELVLIEIINKLPHPREILQHFPGNAFTEPIKRKLLSNDPDTIFFFPPEIQHKDINSWILAFQLAIKQNGFTGRHGDPGIDEFWSMWVPENIRRDPRMIRLKDLYAKAEKELEYKQTRYRHDREEEAEQQASTIANAEIERIRQLSRYPKK